MYWSRDNDSSVRRKGSEEPVDRGKQEKLNGPYVSPISGCELPGQWFTDKVADAGRRDRWRFDPPQARWHSDSRCRFKSVSMSHGLR